MGLGAWFSPPSAAGRSESQLNGPADRRARPLASVAVTAGFGARRGRVGAVSRLGLSDHGGGGGHLVVLLWVHPVEWMDPTVGSTAAGGNRASTQSQLVVCVVPWRSARITAATAPARAARPVSPSFW